MKFLLLVMKLIQILRSYLHLGSCFTVEQQLDANLFRRSNHFEPSTRELRNETKFAPEEMWWGFERSRVPHKWAGRWQAVRNLPKRR